MKKFSTFLLALVTVCCGPKLGAGQPSSAMRIVHYAPLVGGREIEWQAFFWDSGGDCQLSAGQGGKAWCLNVEATASERTIAAELASRVRTVAPRHEERGDPTDGETSAYPEYWTITVLGGSEPVGWEARLGTHLSEPIIKQARLLFRGRTVLPRSGPAQVLAMALTPREAAEAERIGPVSVIANDTVLPSALRSALTMPGRLFPFSEVAVPVALDGSRPVVDVRWSGRLYRLNFFVPIITSSPP